MQIRAKGLANSLSTFGQHKFSFKGDIPDIFKNCITVEQNAERLKMSNDDLIALLINILEIFNYLGDFLSFEGRMFARSGAHCM